MIAGLCESPLTFQGDHDPLRDELLFRKNILLRDGSTLRRHSHPVWAMEEETTPVRAQSAGPKQSLPKATSEVDAMAIRSSND